MHNFDNLSLVEIDNKIQDISKKIYLVSDPYMLEQLYAYLDELYQIQDEKYFMEGANYEDGISYDSEKDIDKTSTPKEKKKKQNFMDRMPKIEIKMNKDNPKNNEN